MINRIRKAYDSKKIIRIISYKKLIGCDEKHLYNHLKSLLPKELIMDDYPKWEIDHIKAINNYDLNDEKTTIKMF